MAPAAVVTSGTAALYLSLLAAGIGPGDRVLVPNYTMIATANAVKWAGAEPELVDVELVVDGDHFRRVVRDGILTAQVSLDIATADFKAMLVPDHTGRSADSIVEIFHRLARKGVLPHAPAPDTDAGDKTPARPLSVGNEPPAALPEESQ